MIFIIYDIYDMKSNIVLCIKYFILFKVYLQYFFIPANFRKPQMKSFSLKDNCDINRAWFL